MATLAPDSGEAKRIDASLQEWRQGDLALDESWFVHMGDGAMPLSDAAAEASDGIQALTSEAFGLVIITQTCDIVRSCVTRPYVEVAPLMRVSEEALHQVKRGRRPAQVTLPALESEQLVADLDRVMTVEKSIVASWKRTPGFTRDADGRAFAQALARKRVRFAFPDDFTAFVRKLLKRLDEKHARDSVEGRALRGLREIRVNAAPSWDHTPCAVTFYFLRNGEDVDFEGQEWSTFIEGWLKLVPESGRFSKIYGQVTTLADLRASDYVDSDPLDLDHLSSRDAE